MYTAIYAHGCIAKIKLRITYAVAHTMYIHDVTYICMYTPYLYPSKYFALLVSNCATII